MDSTLVVVYSHTGTSRAAAELLCSHHGWPMGVVSDAGPRGWIRCVLDSMLLRSPEIRYDGPEPRDFHTLVLVTPVWMYRMAGPMRSFVRQHRHDFGHVAVIATMGSGGAVNVFREVHRLLGRAPVLTAAFRQSEILDGSGTGRLVDFGDVLRGEAGPAPQADSAPQPVPASVGPIA